MKTVWIPEAPDHPGLYANESGTEFDHLVSKVGTAGKQPSTINPHKAKHFATFDECQQWCLENPSPVFVPREHGFDDVPGVDRFNTCQL